MEDKMQGNMVSYYNVEYMMAREERHIKRLIVALILTVTMLFSSNLAWLYCWQMYDYSGTETVTVDGKDGVANYVGNDGEIINNGESGSGAAQSAPEEEKARSEGHEAQEE